jgi:hypothetical protein
MTTSSKRSEPLILFTLVAAGIFLLDAVRNGDAAVEEATAPVLVAGQADLGTIVVDAPLVTALEEEYAWLEGVQPSPETTELLVQEWIDDELVFRHALSQGMHLSDAKLREHLIEKVHLLWAGTAETQADDKTLLDYYMANLDRYYAEPRISFVQAFYEQAPDDPAALLATLNEGGTVEDDGYWMGSVMDGYAESILKTSFGGEFYLALQDAPLDCWVGPLESPRGFHFVKVTQRTPRLPLAFSDIHDRVASDHVDQQLRDRVMAQTEELRAQFSVQRSAE